MFQLNQEPRQSGFKLPLIPTFSKYSTEPSHSHSCRKRDPGEPSYLKMAKQTEIFIEKVYQTEILNDQTEIFLEQTEI